MKIRPVGSEFFHPTDRQLWRT